MIDARTALARVDGRRRACRARASRSSTASSPAASQNEIYEIRRGDLHGALRIPPPTAPAGRDEGILREWRIIEALDGTDVPAHRGRSRVCADPSVLGRTFYLMGFVDGWSPMDQPTAWPAPFDTDLDGPAGPRATSWSRASRCCRKVDWQAKGLQDLGRPDGFHERQVDRWTAFLERIKGRELPGLRRGVGVAAGAPAARLHPRASCTATTSSPT